MAKGGQGDDGEGFLGRWARRKQENREPVPEDDAPDGMEGEAGAAAADPDAPLSEEQVQALPDPESLTAGDDWSIFMKKGVPEELQRRALRRMWRLDPKFNFLDGMDDYCVGLYRRRHRRGRPQEPLPGRPGHGDRGGDGGRIRGSR